MVVSECGLLVRDGRLPGEPDPLGAATVCEALVVDHASGEADQGKARVVRRTKYVRFQLAEVAEPSELIQTIPGRIRYQVLPERLPTHRHAKNRGPKSLN